MHIASGFLSPSVWAASAAVSGAAVAVSAAVAHRYVDERRVPLMGVMGAFIFAAQMVNFPVLPGTSGHLGGGFLLGILLGAPLGVIVMASVLVVQALLFQDGGIEALGANIFIMGVMPCLLGAAVRGLWLRPKPGAATYAVTLALGILAIVAGATGAILFLWLSDSLPRSVSLAHALGLMGGIHAVIGVVEGVATASVVKFVLAMRRDAVLGPLAAEYAKGVTP
ncbi:MAG: energy-coupling factor ABC transporter permease [Planctomycetota bacterium]|nr:energy-coupling factor ABC transporter permease [Planctomycetota bacterium]